LIHGEYKDRITELEETVKSLRKIVENLIKEKEEF
jgi:hypothetical protein